MNWFFMLLAAVAGGVATWLFSVRTVRRRVPVYEPVPARRAVVETEDTPAAAAPKAASAATVVAEVPAAAAEETGGALDAPGPKRKPRGKKRKQLAPGPYGPGSAAANEDGSGPEGWTVKGNANSGLYHAPESPWYSRTKAEAWFESEAAAQAAGFAHWNSRPKD
jgi:hypothetical protein